MVTGLSFTKCGPTQNRPALTASVELIWISIYGCPYRAGQWLSWNFHQLADLFVGNLHPEVVNGEVRYRSGGTSSDGHGCRAPSPIDCIKMHCFVSSRCMNWESQSSVRKYNIITKIQCSYHWIQSQLRSFVGFEPTSWILSFFSLPNPVVTCFSTSLQRLTGLIY